MRVIKPFFYVLFAVVFILQSCSIEKRHYTSGYSIRWKQNKNTTQLANAESKKANDDVSNHNSLTASSENKNGMVLLATDSIGCDTLVMKDGTAIKVKVLEITPTEVKYKYCNNVDGPTYVTYRYNIARINYKNGTSDTFVNEQPPVAAPANRSNNYPPGSYLNNGSYNNNRGAMGSAINNYALNEYVRRTSLGSLVCGILSIFIPYIGVLFAIAAIVLGRKCMRLIRQDPENLWIYSRRANAGLILGWVVVGIYLLIILIALILALAI